VSPPAGDEAEPQASDTCASQSGATVSSQPSLVTIAREWGRIGLTGFGGPPAHIALLRRLCVEDRRWITAQDFQDGVATTNLLPGPASTQLAIFCAWRLQGACGALIGGACFILPGLVIILGLSVLFLEHHPASWLLGAAAGADAVVPAVALGAAVGFVPASWRRMEPGRSGRVRWVLYGLSGGAAAATIGPYLVLVLLGCGAIEVATRSTHRTPRRSAHAVLIGAFGHSPLIATLAAGSAAMGGLGAVAWVALKVGALSYGGGFVIIPLMQHDAVTTYHFMTGPQFLDAVALGQVTPGPVVLTVAVVGYAAHGLAGALIAVTVAFAPSFGFIMIGGPRFDQLRSSETVQAFLTGAGPAVIGAIAGSAIPLGLALGHWWQVPVLGAALVWLIALRRGVVPGLLGAAGVGVLLALSGVAV